ncbi:hypothetical protein ONZ45_g16248 [Pleurotus djamor]|nr:hypothetical protein ONZ45_g16248 [Pleurotus djamor]
MCPSTVEEYAQARAALVAEDRRLRRDHNYAPTEREEAADRVIRAIRAKEATTVWGAEHPDIPHPFPGMEFLTGRSVIVQTQIYDILTKASMPKGGLLHAHLDATVNVGFLLKLAYEQPALHIRITNQLDAHSISSTLPEFKAFPQNEWSQIPTLADHPAEWVRLSQAKETFPDSLGGPEGFDKWITSCITINPSEAYGTHNTVAKIWDKFTSTFIVVGGLTRYAPIFRDYVKQFLRSSVEDGILYVEPRINFLEKFMHDVDGNPTIPHREWLVMFNEVLEEFKDELKSQGRQDEFIGAKIIYSTIRFITPDDLDWYTEDCIALKKEFPHLIAGFDLVGNENQLIPLIKYIDPLLRFRKRQAEEGVDIPFLFHAGETFGDGTDADMNIYDAILLGTKRIGHGFSLVKHPKLMELCRERGIALEVCPISNEILRLTSSIPMHPLPILFNNGVPVALSSDDPSVFGNMGLTFDFYQAGGFCCVLVSSEVTGLTQLREVARDSIKFSMLEPEEKERALGMWEKQWARFVEEVAVKLY